MSASPRLQRRSLLAAAASLLLAACASPGRQLAAAPESDYWSGRLSVQVQTDPPQFNSGEFELSGNARAGELVLLNPLGNIVARLQWAQGQASITQGSSTRSSDSLSALVQELLGTPLPIEALFDWLRGQATRVQGWEADLGAIADGKLTAHRYSPQPEASLRIVFTPR
ncbi:hypothetical protein GCM10027082_46540 [Comamonas humi]